MTAVAAGVSWVRFIASGVDVGAEMHAEAGMAELSPGPFLDQPDGREVSCSRLHIEIAVNPSGTGRSKGFEAAVDETRLCEFQ